MSNQADSGRASIRDRNEVLGYLLKHAHLALEGYTDAALARFGITSRDLGALRVIAGGEAKSQQDVAGILGVDRTSMVALLDGLEHRGIVARRPAEQDRRRNVVMLTGDGWDLFRRAENQYAEAEQEFTAVLGDDGAAGLRQALRTVLAETAAPEQEYRTGRRP